MTTIETVTRIFAELADKVRFLYKDRWYEKYDDSRATDDRERMYSFRPNDPVVVQVVQGSVLMLGDKVTEICICPACTELQDKFPTCDVDSRRVRCDLHQPRNAT